MLKRYRQRKTFKQGCDLLQKADWVGAELAFRNAISIESSHAESHHNLGIALLRLARWEEAAAAVQRAIALDGGSADPHLTFATTLLKMSRWEECVAACRRGIADHTKSAGLHEKLGTALAKLERWGEAAEAYRDAVALEPGDPALNLNLAGALLKLDRTEEAADAFRQALARDPDNAAATTGLNAALARLSGREESSGAPEIADALGELRVGMSFSKLGRWQEAAAALRDGISCFQFLLVDPLVQLGRFEEAAAAFRQAIELGTTRPHLPGDNPAARFASRRDRFWTAGNLGPDVFRIANWLERSSSGSTGAEMSAANPKLLFVLDNDYGELTTIMYLLAGRSLLRNTTVLLPPRLYPKNVDVLPGRIRQYESLDDILGAVDREQPDIVFLCSGYLMTIHELLTLEDLERLSAELRGRGCRVVTCDPFLGLFLENDPRSLVSIQIPTDSAEFDPDHLKRTKETQDERLWTHFSRCAEIFRNTPHLFPACDHSPGTPGEDPRYLSFYNESLTGAPLPERDQSTAASGGKPHWLFLLSQTDFDTQVMFQSHARFTDIVAARLLDTLAAGRHPILVAPKEFISRLEDRMPTSEGVDLLHHCPFKQLLPLLLGAEYVFYWNVLSHTILIRLFNRLPTVVFDKGHLVRNVPALYDRIVQWYYQGWNPSFADQRASLTLESVEAYVEPYRREAAAIVRRFAQAPSPEHMIQNLMAADALAAR
jgi:tetratricopeptide (TPR) repeat protein